MHSAAEVFILLEWQSKLQVLMAEVTDTLVTYPWALSCACVSHLDEHSARLGGDSRQLLQEALGKAQVLFQTLVLCRQTQNPLLWVCGPLRKWNMRFSLTMRDASKPEFVWMMFLYPGFIIKVLHKACWALFGISMAFLSVHVGK